MLLLCCQHAGASADVGVPIGEIVHERHRVTWSEVGE